MEPAIRFALIFIFVMFVVIVKILQKQQTEDEQRFNRKVNEWGSQQYEQWRAMNRRRENLEE